MGSPSNEAGRKEDEGPQHKVRVDDFYLCTTETTIKLFMAYYVETVTGKKDFITVDEEKKAAMVSNLMVVLCGDKDATPVVNTGTLHQ